MKLLVCVEFSFVSCELLSQSLQMSCHMDVLITAHYLIRTLCSPGSLHIFTCRMEQGVIFKFY